MSTRRELFASLGSDLVETLTFNCLYKRSETSRHIKRTKVSLPVDMRHSETSLLKLPIESYHRYTPTNKLRPLR